MKCDYWEPMSICFLYLRTYNNIYVHAEIKGKKINIIVFSFQIYSHCHPLTYNSFIWNNERLLGIFGSRLSTQALNPQPFFLAVLFFMLFISRKQIVNVFKSFRLHWPIGLMPSIIITSKITSFLGSLEIWGPNVFFCVTNFIVVSKTYHLF